MNKWKHLGHTLSECWYNKDDSIVYVHIPKNASSTIKGCLLSTEKFVYSDVFVNASDYLIALRNPIERWVSGMAQFITNSNSTIDDYSQITFDDHTETQSYFLQDIDTKKCTFFLVNENLTKNLQSWFDEKNYTIKNIQTRNSSTNDNRKDLKVKIQEYIDTHPDFVVQLKEHYKEDYNLINSVNFYGI